MESRDEGQFRWRWSEVSPRRMVGTVIRALGAMGAGASTATYALGDWNPELHPAFLAASIVMLLLSVPLLWRVKPAPWP